MPLRLYLDHCENPDELMVNGMPDLVSEQLGMAMIPTGIAKITTANYHEMARRVEAVEQVLGSFMMNSGGPVYFTLEDIRRRVGMYSNATTKTKTQFDREIRDEQKRAGGT